MTLLWFGKHGLPPVAALAELPKRQIFVSFKSVISPNPFPLKKGSIIFEMAVSQHAFSTDHRAQLCLGTDCHKLLHATCWLGLRKYLVYASVPAAQKNSRGKMPPNVYELPHFQSFICTWETRGHNMVYLGTGIYIGEPRDTQVP